MDWNPPTTADYAAADAQDAKRKNETLEKRVAELEREVLALDRALDAVINRLGKSAPPA
jgi:uncharacterized protein YceH (UPF0502 family)